MKKKIEKKCECCGKELEIVFGNSHYCSSCATYHTELKNKIVVLERNLRKCKEKLEESNEKNKS